MVRRVDNNRNSLARLAELTQALQKAVDDDARLESVSRAIAEGDWRSRAAQPADRAGYRELSDAGTKTARLDAKTRELIALAVCVTRQCDGCITTHVHAARKHGATAEEIAEALGVAIAVNAGAGLLSR